MLAVLRARALPFAVSRARMLVVPVSRTWGRVQPSLFTKPQAQVAYNSFFFTSAADALGLDVRLNQKQPIWWYICVLRCGAELVAVHPGLRHPHVDIAADFSYSALCSCSERTGVQLKDKWRNLVKFKHIGRVSSELGQISSLSFRSDPLNQPA